MNCLLKVSILFLFILFFLILFTLFIHNMQFLGDSIRKISKLKPCGTFCCGVASGSFSGCCSWRCSGGPEYYLPAHLEEGSHRESYVFAEHLAHPLMVQT